jgi:hypothetical protein
MWILFFCNRSASTVLRLAQSNGPFFDTTPLIVGERQFHTSALLVPMTDAARQPSSFVSFNQPADVDAVILEPSSRPIVIQANRNCVVSIPRMKPHDTETATAQFVHEILEAQQFDVCAIEVHFCLDHDTQSVIASARIAFDTEEIAKKASLFLRTEDEFRDTHVATCASAPFIVRSLERVGMPHPLRAIEVVETRY